MNLYFRGGLNDGVAQTLDLQAHGEVHYVYDHFSGPSEIYRPTNETITIDGTQYTVYEYDRDGT